MSPKGTDPLLGFTVFPVSLVPVYHTALFTHAITAFSFPV